MSKSLSSLSPKQKKMSLICVGVCFLICGIFLLLVSSKIIDIGIKDAALPAIIVGFGLAFITSALAQDNSLGLWIGGVVFTIGIATFLGEYLDCGFKGIIFVYFLAPAFASLLTMIKSKRYKVNIKVIALFSFVSLTALSSNYFDRAIVLSCGLIAISIVIIISAFFKENKR